jgi:acyl-[acyl carrier protein]--UDP-N-acetylglucosamine O-acyltransferase
LASDAYQNEAAGGIRSPHARAQEILHPPPFGREAVAKDVLPFCIADGHPSVMRGINKVGLERNGFATSQIRSIRSACRTLLRQTLPLRDVIVLLKNEVGSGAETAEMIEFAETSALGLARSRTTSAEN